MDGQGYLLCGREVDREKLSLDKLPRKILSKMDNEENY